MLPLTINQETNHLKPPTSSFRKNTSEIKRLAGRNKKTLTSGRIDGHPPIRARIRRGAYTEKRTATAASTTAPPSSSKSKLSP